ncbi:MAG: DUF1501 domain-containing protein [Microthrixaceae bacterium]
MTQLVNVFLRGGADGLSIFAPVSDPAYLSARPTLAVRSEDSIDVGIGGFAVHPAAPRIAELIRSRTAAAVPAAGFDGQTRSHFESQANLESAVGLDGSYTEGGGLGWLSEVLSAGSGDTLAPFRAVAVGSVSLPMSMAGTNDALGAPSPDALRLGALTFKGFGTGARYEVVAVDDSPTGADMVDLWRGSAGAPPITGVSVEGAAAVLERLSTAPIEVPDSSLFGMGESAPVFAAASALLAADLGTEIVQIDMGGWDTHSAQGTLDGRFAGLLAELDAGIGALVDRHMGSGDGLVITVMTEFGRRVKENASGGTDHGRGGLALVIGDGVDGGLKGTWPGLAELDAGDVPAVNDLRAVQAEVAAAALGSDAATPGDSAPLGLFA